MEIVLNVNKIDVYKEVDKTTSYTGAKMIDANEAVLDRIGTVDEDQELLERFWNESRAEIAQNMIGTLQSEVMSGEQYTLTLNVSASFDKALQPSMQISLFSYFVQNIIAKWFVLPIKMSPVNMLIMRGHSSMMYAKKSFLRRNRQGRSMFNHF
ncbi:hypothetical protein EVA_19120 [gut metagenome]|uniref:Uncharacterized protein n=1 Tax=gut metagenome TaxID=749906 RepID=J9BYW4_9ZZZZ